MRDCRRFRSGRLLVIAVAFHIARQPLALTQALEALQHLLNRLIAARPDLDQRNSLPGTTNRTEQTMPEDYSGEQRAYPTPKDRLVAMAASEFVSIRSMALENRTCRPIIDALLMPQNAANPVRRSPPGSKGRPTLPSGPLNEGHNRLSRGRLWVPWPGNLTGAGPAFRRRMSQR